MEHSGSPKSQEAHRTSFRRCEMSPLSCDFCDLSLLPCFLRSFLAQSRSLTWNTTFIPCLTRGLSTCRKVVRKSIATVLTILSQNQRKALKEAYSKRVWFYFQFSFWHTRASAVSCLITPIDMTGDKGLNGLHYCLTQKIAQQQVVAMCFSAPADCLVNVK